MRANTGAARPRALRHVYMVVHCPFPVQSRSLPLPYPCTDADDDALTWLLMMGTASMGHVLP